MSNYPYTIRIKLNAERNSIEFSDREELIHQKELDTIVTHIEDSLKKALKYSTFLEENQRIVRTYDTITLSGGRGSGKTTFISSLFNLIRLNRINRLKPESNPFSSDIEILDMLDPTLIEEKGHIFLNVIAKIKERVDNKSIGIKCDNNKTDDPQNREYRYWEESLKKLAEGLPCIDGVGTDVLKQLEWHDSEYVMEQGIRGVKAANDLEKNFHMFVSRSLKLLGRRAFLLAFDDVDTNFNKGFPVLETLHKYLTTPQMITILSGDLSLYSILIRKKQWEAFGDVLLSVEDKLKHYEKYELTVTRIEEQYFQKLLRPERRIYLSTLLQKEEIENYEILIIPPILETDQKNNDASFRKTEFTFRAFLDEKLSLLGIVDGRQERYFHQYLANLPIRTQTQFMYLMCLNKQSIKLAILELFWNDLAARNIDVSTLRDHPEVSIIQFLEYLIKHDILTEGYSFRPVFNDMILNGAQFSAGSLLSLSFSQRPSLIFEYWFRIGLTRDLNFLFQPHRNSATVAYSLDNYITHCALMSRRKTSHLARMIVAYLRGMQNEGNGLYSNKFKPWIGIVPLYSPDNRDGFSLNEILAQQTEKLSKVLGYLPFSIATNNKGFNLSSYSIYSLLGVIGEIVEYLDYLNPSRRDTEEYIYATKGVMRICSKNAQPRYYPLPNKKSEEEFLPDFHEDEDISRDELESSGFPNFAMQIVDWYLTKPTREIHPYLAAKIFTRFFYVIGRINLSEDNLSVGYWLHRVIIAFLNSVLVEEFLENDSAGELIISLNNPVKEDRIFINNLKSVTSNEENIELELARWLISCPLWGHYLQRDELLIKNLNQFCKFHRNEYFRWPNKSIYTVLSKVPIYYPRKSIVEHQYEDEKKTFRVGNKQAIKYFINAAYSRGLSPNFGMNMSEDQFYDIVCDLLNDNYKVKKVSTTSLKKKIAAGKIKW